MARARIVGMVLGLALAAGAMAASAASATPTWYYCAKAVPADTGHYKNSKCSEPAPEGNGKYELVPGIGKGKDFKAKSTGSEGTAIVLPYVEGIEHRLECRSVEATGSVAAPNREVGVVLTFKECGSSEGCSNKPGVITTEPLEGELGYVSSEGPVVGIDLTSEAEPGSGNIALIYCSNLPTVRLRGSVIGIQTGDINNLSKTADVEYRYSAAGEENGFHAFTNLPEAFEGASRDVLTGEYDILHGGGWSGAGAAIEAQLAVSGEGLMIKA